MDSSLHLVPGRFKLPTAPGGSLRKDSFIIGLSIYFSTYFFAQLSSQLEHGHLSCLTSGKETYPPKNSMDIWTNGNVEVTIICLSDEFKKCKANVCISELSEI